jgi:hypothetical protein
MNDEWYYSENGQQRGPVGAQELRRLAASGQLQPTDQVWREGMATWQPANSVPDVIPTFATGAPPVLPTAANEWTGNPYQAPSRFASGDQPASGGATAGFVLGLFSLIAWLLPILGYPVGGIGLYLSLKGRKSPPSGLAIAGIVLNCLGLVLSLINSAIGAYLAVKNVNR